MTEPITIDAPIWAPIPDNPGYFVSEHGDVTGPNGLLKAGRSGGYRRVKISGRQHYVHRLVAAAFIGPCPDGLVTRHLDGNYDNNRADNLVYAKRWSPLSLEGWLRQAGAARG